MAEFGAADNLIIVLEGKDRNALKEAAPLIAEGLLAEKKWIKSVFYRTDTTMILRSMPLFIPLENLKTGLSGLSTHTADIKGLLKINDIVALLREMKKASSNPIFTQYPEAAPQLMSILNGFLEEWIEWIKNPKHNKLTITERIFLPGTEPEYMVKSEGFLFSRDFSMLILMAQPSSPNDDMKYLKPFIKSMRAACDKSLKSRPDLKKKIKIAFTGMPAHVYTETETIQYDVGGAGTVAVIIVAIIMLAGFRSIRKTIIGIIPILYGLLITLGLISIIVGRLNLISSAMLAVLYGIGIDFSIYLIQRTEEELGNGMSIEAAVYHSVVTTSKSIVTGGLTTSLAFFAIGLSKFVGYSELGITAGIGILVMMCCAFLILPALIFMFPVEPRKYDLKKTVDSAYSPKRHKILVGVMIVAAAVSAFSIFACFRIRMDYNALDLLPRNTESTIYQKRMEAKSDFSVSTVMVTSKNFVEMQDIVERMSKLKTVSRVDSLNRLLPDHQEEKIRMLSQYKKTLGTLTLPDKFKEHEAEEYASALQSLVLVFEEAQEKAFSGGMTQMVEKLDKLLANIHTLEEAFAGKDRESAVRRTHEFEQQLYKEIQRGLTIVDSWFNLKPITEDNLPESFITRFKSPKGTYVAYIYPKGSIWDIDFLDKLIKDLKSISKNITGFPVTHRVYIRLAASAITEAILYSFFMVVLLLFIEFRKILVVNLSLIPLILAMLWLQGMLFLFHTSYDVANIAGLPLLFGLGVVYGVRIVHRWQEKPHLTAFAAVRTTGKGVFFAATATMSGIFSIVFARHNGVSSFGFILLLGLGLCLVAALVVLPSLIDLIYLKKNSQLAVEQSDLGKEAPGTHIKETSVKKPTSAKKPQHKKSQPKNASKPKKAKTATQKKTTKK